MTKETMTLTEIQQVGLAALSRELGPVGYIRFLQMFETGHGDYTKERSQWLGEQSLDEILARIKQQRNDSELN